MRLLRLCLLILALRLFLSDPIIVYDSFVVSLKGELSWTQEKRSPAIRSSELPVKGFPNLTGQYVTPKHQKSQAESVFRTKKFTKVTYPPSGSFPVSRYHREASTENQSISQAMVRRYS